VGGGDPLGILVFVEGPDGKGLDGGGGGRAEKNQRTVGGVPTRIEGISGGGLSDLSNHL